MTTTDIQAMGFRLAIYPGVALGAAVIAVDAALHKLAGTSAATSSDTGPMALFRRLGADEWDAMRRQLDRPTTDDIAAIAVTTGRFEA